MPWWSWALIWSGLILGLLGTLAWFGFSLFKKLMATVDALRDLGGQVAALGRDQAPPEQAQFRPGIFQNREDLQLAVELLRDERQHRRQARRDSLIARGKLLQHVPLNRRTDPDA
ncbi:hypothetical protein E3T24_14430 [Cryobacterium sp. TmT2-59]|uniref:hypothetical protein n=1 Tax=Cryobacterium sp. TmT2-59 TaxID=1259264 RepID=UPI00106B6370|nr:hypothetical protein [Cryobacterium sp. TmT2-59]TFC81949.1 hypothetical protein E3T24_14430 [Cryobacterium sp. TmT2-59]